MKPVYDPELTQVLIEALGSNCEDCTESGREQHLISTGLYKDDGKGIYPMIFCQYCRNFIKSGDGDFHTYYRIRRNAEGVWIESVEANWR